MGLWQKGRFDMSKIHDINETKEMDSVLSEALRPTFSPSSELNRQLLSGEARSDGSRQKTALKKMYLLPKVAAIVLAVLCVGGAGVYAATKLLTPKVTDHAVSVGNTEYVDDAAIARTEEPVTTKEISSEQGTADTPWTSRTVSEVNGYVTTTCTFDSYERAMKEAGLGVKFSKEYEPSSQDSIVYSSTEGNGYKAVEISGGFNYQEGSFTAVQSKNLEGVSNDAAYSIQLKNTSNERDYSTKTGVTYHLVDETMSGEEGNEVNTYVMLATDAYEGYIRFHGLTEEQIHEVLDTVVME